jgi:hypothetical protein
LAIVFGFCGTKFSVPFSNAVAIGEQPAACAPDMRVCGVSMRPALWNSCRDFQIFVYIEPDAIGATMWSGVRQPSCSAISKPIVREPSA